MFYRCAWLVAALSLLVGCAEPSEGLDAVPPVEVGSIQASLDACNESVPETRKVDGVPAYAQCASVAQGAIFSNNGIDTSATKVASDWVQTQFSGGYQCTELAHRYLLFKWKVKWIPNGNAGEWCNSSPPASSGVVQTTTPVHGDLIVFAPSSCGADSVYGHVAVVDVVDAAKGKVTAVEQNMARRGSYNTTCGKCFLHVVANDGTNPGETLGGGTPAADAGSKPVIADAGVTTPRARDAGVDSGSRPSMTPVVEDEDEEPAVESGKKVDAGARKDAGAKDAGKIPEDEEDDEDEDEVAEEPAPASAASDGCNVARGPRGASTLLACLAALLLRRRRQG